MHGVLQKSAEAIQSHYRERREKEGLERDEQNFLATESNIAKYYPPEKVDPTTSSGTSIDDAMSDADAFLSNAEEGVADLDQNALKDFSNSFYNIFLTVGTAMAVIIGVVIGIKYMVGSIEEKADIKKTLIPYAVGCIVVFGSFGIWKMIIEIMQSI